MFIQYADHEISYLTAKDKRLGQAIQQIGRIDREVDSDLFSATIHHINGQQISTAAQTTVWTRSLDTVGMVSVDSLASLGREHLDNIPLLHRRSFEPVPPYHMDDIPDDPRKTTPEQWEAMRKVDIGIVENFQLVDIRTIKIDEKLSLHRHRRYSNEDQLPWGEIGRKIPAHMRRDFPSICIERIEENGHLRSASVEDECIYFLISTPLSFS